MNILLYQNKPADALKIYLEHFGYNVIMLDYARILSFPAILNSQPFDLLILEELPEVNCFDHLNKIGFLNAEVPKILLTANSAEVFLVNALDKNFAAIWLKPISPKVLFAQMKLLADPSFKKANTNVYIDLFDGVVYNATTGTIEKDTKVLVSFNNTEARIFKVLADHINKPLLKEEIMKQAGSKIPITKNSRSFNVILSYIRTKLKIIPTIQIISPAQKQLMLFINKANYLY